MYKNWLTEDIESMASSINYSEILEIAKKIDLKNAFKENYETLSKREYFEKLNLRYQDFIANSTIGIAMLVKNQENRIYPAISNLLDLCDEFVVVDTVSTDKTVEQINKIESDKLQLFSKEWVEDFSLMRNFASSKVTTDWIFFVDSDEVLFETIDKNILRNIAALLASLSNESIAIQFKIKRPNQNSFTLAERGLRKGTTHYVNKIHEELYDAKITKVRIDFLLENQGALIEEMEKFNKLERYTKLVNEELEKTTGNIKMLLNFPFPQGDAIECERYFKLVDCVILKKEKQGWKKHNFQLTDDFHTLTQKYIMLLLSLGRINELIDKTAVLLGLFSDNYFLLSMNNLGRILKQHQKQQKQFELFLEQYSEINNETSFETTLMSKDYASAIAVKYLFSLGDYKNAVHLSLDITDQEALQLIQTESKFLKIIDLSDEELCKVKGGNISKKIKLERQALNLTQECLAQKLFVSPPVIANWEHERSYPNIQQVLALSEFFGKSTDYLLKD